MCIENTHFKCLKSYYRDSRVEVTHLLSSLAGNLKYPIYDSKNVERLT